MREIDRHLEWDSELPPESAFTDSTRSKLRIWITIISIVSSLGLLALVLLVAIYTMNVGTIWSSQRASAVSSSQPGLISVRNETSSTVILFYRDRSGSRTLIGSIFAMHASKLRIGRQCLNGDLIARSGPISRTSPRLCAGDTWIIKPS
ncbi:MAG: hypothetical protein ACYDCC_02005 [Actinomycetota bacterium]